MGRARANQYLPQTASLLSRMQTHVDRLDGDLVKQDIAARRQEARIGVEFAQRVERIEAALKAVKSNLSLDQWCKQNCGCDISTMRRRKRLYKHWRLYEEKRRALGACGQSGLLFALSLVKDALAEPATNRQAVPARIDSGTVIPLHDVRGCQFITGDALSELSKLAAQSVNVVLTSPPYWPPKRSYGQTGIGFEKSSEDYIKNLVAVFHQTQRVLRDDGVLWVSIDDGYDDNDLLFIPARLAMAMQSDGWVCRSEIVWSKRGGGRPDSVANRPVKDYEKVLMFTKQKRGYFYDGDPIRVPLKHPYAIPGRKKPGTYRKDWDRTQRVWSNPMGRSGGSVWEITPSSYQGNHAATMPEELVQRCLAISCPEEGVVLDCFGGAGTVALVAVRSGLRAISIEINPAYTEEARKRVSRDMIKPTKPDLHAAD